MASIFSISGKISSQNSKPELGPRDTNQKNTKLGHKGALRGSRDLLFNFGTPLISRERLKLQTSNFATGLTIRDTKRKSAKFVKRGRGLGHVTYFLNFGTPLISLKWL